MLTRCLIVAALLAVGAARAQPQLENGLPRGLPLDANNLEKRNAAWTMAFDNDLLAFTDRDFDYTGGFAVTFAGTKMRYRSIVRTRACCSSLTAARS